jgi:pyruvate kinase
VHAALAEAVPTYDEMWQVARSHLLAREYVSPGASVVVTAGVPFDVSGTTNLLKVEVV